MRKIERDMIAAIRARKDWKSGNTQCLRADAEGTMEVLLHGNTIAFIADSGLRFTLAGWPTPTTRSRVNVQQVRRVMKATANRGYDPRNSADAMARQWSLAFRFGRVK